MIDYTDDPDVTDIIEPDEINNNLHTYINPNNAFLKIQKEDEMHWTERERLGYKPSPMSPRDYGDNNPADPEENWEKDEQD